MKRLRLTPEAELDRDVAYLWYQEQAPGRAGDFLAAVNKCITSIRRHPEAYQLVDAAMRRASRLSAQVPLGDVLRRTRCHHGPSQGHRGAQAVRHAAQQPLKLSVASIGGACGRARHAPGTITRGRSLAAIRQAMGGFEHVLY